MGIIDSHIHVGLNEFCINKDTGFNLNLQNSYTDLLTFMDNNNIQKSVILPIPHKDFDPIASNEYLISAYNLFSERFIPFCRIDSHLEDNFKIGFKGAKLHLLFEEVQIKEIKKELQFLESIGAPIIVHALFSNKVKQMKDLLKIAPNLKIILAHMGRGNIYTNESVIENAAALRKYDNIYFETSTVGISDTIKEVCNIIGTERVIFGSDHPFGVSWFANKRPYSYDEEISIIKDTGLSNDMLHKIFYSNIANLLYLDNKENKLTIRKVCRGDYSQLNDLFFMLSETDRKFLALDQKVSLIKQNIKSETHCYVALLNCKIVGFMRESGRPEGYSLLEELLIHPDYRNKGYARKMMHYYHRIFNKNFAKTNAKNNGIIKLLQSSGYIANNPDAARIINWVRSVD